MMRPVEFRAMLSMLNRRDTKILSTAPAAVGCTSQHQTCLMVIFLLEVQVCHTHWVCNAGTCLCTQVFKKSIMKKLKLKFKDI